MFTWPADHVAWAPTLAAQAANTDRHTILASSMVGCSITQADSRKENGLDRTPPMGTLHGRLAVSQRRQSPNEECAAYQQSMAQTFELNERRRV